MNIEEIREYKKYQVGTRHSERVRNQKTDQGFFEDKYIIPFVKAKYQLRTGFVAEMANGITQQSIASQPKVFTKPRQETKEIEDASDRVASLLNKWGKGLSKQSTNPFKQTFKATAFTRGEAWVYTPHKTELALWKGDTSWQEKHPDIIPVHFILYDPMVVFADPSEFVDGKPTRVLVYYKRKVADVKASYPKFNTSAGDSELVEFLFYVDKDTMYAEADEKPLFLDKNGKLTNGDGRRKNIYGLIPFAHCYSGYGQDTEDHNPEMLAFTRTRMIQDKVTLDATMASAFRHNIIEFAWRARTVLNQSGVEISPDAYREYRPNEPGKLNELTLPPGASVKVEESQLFEAPVFAYRERVKADLEGAYPGSLKGVAQGSSGRQEDILAGAGLSFYDAPIENNATLWVDAFDNALKICYEIPDMIPPKMQSKDVDSYSEIEVRIKAEDPLETLRNKADGDRKYQLGIIDDMTNLLQYQGFTKEEARKIMARKLVDDVTRNNPVVRELMGLTLAQEMGVLEEYQQLSQQGKGGIKPTPEFGSRGGEPREGNVKTELGREMPDMSLTREPRRAPVGG